LPDSALIGMLVRDGSVDRTCWWDPEPEKLR
jgi:hypothetical protein